MYPNEAFIQYMYNAINKINVSSTHLLYLIGIVERLSVDTKLL